MVRHITIGKRKLKKKTNSNSQTYYHLKKKIRKENKFRRLDILPSEKENQKRKQIQTRHVRDHIEK